MVVSENRGPKDSALNSRILIIRTPRIRYPRIFGNAHISFGWLGLGALHPTAASAVSGWSLRGRAAGAAFEASEEKKNPGS